MAIIKPGFRGICKIIPADGDWEELYLRCTDFNLAPSQTVQFYDHVIGLKDTVPTDSSTKDEDDSAKYINTQKTKWRASVISYAGSISFPATLLSGCNDNDISKLQTVFDLSKYGVYFDVQLYYHCKENSNSGNLVYRKFIDCRVNNFSFNVTSGDIINISMDIMGKDMDEGTSTLEYRDTEKFITWDAMDFTISGPEHGFDIDAIQSFNFNINNNLVPIYTGNTLNPLKPYDLRVGMQEITGSFSLYNKDGRMRILPEYTDIPNEVKINICDSKFNETLNCIFLPSAVPSGITTVITNIPFVGVDKAFGE